MAALTALLLLAADVTVRLSSGPNHASPHVTRMPMEDYVAGVLEGEASVMRATESLKAMAVAARTYAERFRGRHASEGFDFCETTHCQDYRRSPGLRMIAAAELTEGELLYAGGRLVEALYSKDCGGRLDALCPRSPWRRDVRRAAAPGPIEELARSARGRERLQLALHLPSPFFEISPFPDRYVFSGSGEGHGRGLCQNGCARMGEAGASYREILARYFAGATVAGAWMVMTGERVDVLIRQPDAALSQVADIALRQAEALAFPFSQGRPRVRVYETVAQFRNATGQSGRVAAVTKGALIRLQPAQVLRSRRALDSTLRHEMLHMVLESRAAPGHPWWFREGLVLFLNGEQPSEPSYDAAVRRVRTLVRDHGQSAVIGWWQRGLPRQIPPRRAH
jgi:stage II sporulation protein D